jgi:hypothetical protein
MTTTPTPSNKPNNDPGEEVPRASPDAHDPQEFMRRVEQRAERENREGFREVRKYLMRGAAIELGMELLHEFLIHLIHN